MLLYVEMDENKLIVQVMPLRMPLLEYSKRRRKRGRVVVGGNHAHVQPNINHKAGVENKANMRFFFQKQNSQ